MPTVVAVREGSFPSSRTRICCIVDLLHYWRVISIASFQTLSKSHLEDFSLAPVCVVQPHLTLSALPPAADRYVALRFSLLAFNARFARSFKSKVIVALPVLKAQRGVGGATPEQQQVPLQRQQCICCHRVE